jgi:hypothetical protein
MNTKNRFINLPCLLLLLFSFPASALNWETVGSVQGVNVYVAQTSSKTIRVRFENTNSYKVKIDGGDAVIWCGGSQSGQGQRQTTVIGRFKLGAGKAIADSGWNHYSCNSTSFHIEFDALYIDPA